jgi:hypothetical protein
MAYQRIATPRIYPCAINHALSLGEMTSANLTQAGITSASPIEMFDLKPSNVVTIGGNGTATQHIIKINFNEPGDTFMSDSNFMLIMGHNFEQAGVTFKLQHDDASDFGSAQSPALTQLVNLSSGGDVSSGDYTGALTYNGWSLFTWDGGDTDNQYYRLILDSESGNYDTDIKISCIIMGEYWSFPHAPDMSIQKSIAFGNTIQESVGGMTYSNASWLAAPHWGGMTEAFEAKNHVTPNQMRKAGKLQYDMNFSYMTDSDIFYSELYQEQDIFTETSFMGNVLQRTLGTHHPFLIQWDDTTVALVRDNFSWVRFSDVPKFNQVANQTWNANVSLTEQF